MQQSNLTNNTQNADSLEKYWYKIYICIILVALQHIPNKKYTIKHSFYTFSPKATALHRDLKCIDSIIYRTKQLVTNSQHISYKILSDIDNINLAHNFDIPHLPHDLQSLPQWISLTKQL